MTKRTYLLLALILLATFNAWTAYSPGTYIVDSTGANKMAVKAASTAPGASDPAAVVSLSPNGNSVAVTSSTLPTGASTSALQTTGNTTLASILSALPAGLGQTTMANSLACVLPSNQSAIPINLQDGSGSAINKGQTTKSGSIPVTIASDQVAPKTYANSAGSFVLNSSLTTVVTESAPANSVGFILEASSSNAANIRWAVGATATTSSGMRLEPGRDTGFVPVGANISIVAESGTLEYELTWIKQ